MKTIIVVLITLVIFPFYLIYSQHNKGSISNPSAAYCIKMGYQYENRKDPNGNEYGVCIFPDKTEIRAWDFFKGKGGETWSYGYLHGYRVKCKKETKGTYSIEYAVCIKYDSKNHIIEEIRQTELMRKNNEPLFPNETIDNSIDQKDQNHDKQIKSSYFNDPNLPPSFNWTFKDGYSYLGPIRNQGSCGACYAFAACAAAECTYDWANSLTDIYCKDFSEAYIIWCLGKYGPYWSHFGGCAGADYDYQELDALTSIGITEESNLPYNNGIDPGGCTYSSYPTIQFQSWHRVACNDFDAIRTAIFNFGAVDASVIAGWEFEAYDDCGIFKDDHNSCDGSPCDYTTVNHGVSIVGWDTDPVAGDYWIIRNQWGYDWGCNGYMNIAVNSAHISCEVAYLEPYPPLILPICGNGVCEWGENSTNCPIDCQPGGPGSGCCVWGCGFKINGKTTNFVEVCPDEPITLRCLGSATCHLVAHHYLSIQECDQDLNLIGQEYYTWITNDCNWDTYPDYEWDLYNLAQSLGIPLSQGKFYKIKLANSDCAPGDPWEEWNKFMHILNGHDFTFTHACNLQDNRKTIFSRGTLITQGDITIKSNDWATFLASDLIDLLPGFNAVQNSYFRALINPVCDSKMGPFISEIGYNNENLEENDYKNDSIDFVKNEIIIYPNPNSGIFTIQFIMKTSPIVMVFDIFGKSVFKNQYDNTDNIIVEMPSLLSGVYYIQIIDKCHNYKNKIVKL